MLELSLAVGSTKFRIGVVSIFIVLLLVVSKLPSVSLLLYLMYEVPSVLICTLLVYAVSGVQAFVESMQYCVALQPKPVPSSQVKVTLT